MSTQAPRSRGDRSRWAMLGAMVVNLLLVVPFAVTAVRGGGFLPWLAAAGFTVAAAASGVGLLVGEESRRGGSLRER